MIWEKDEFNKKFSRDIRAEAIASANEKSEINDKIAKEVDDFLALGEESDGDKGVTVEM